MDNKKMLLQFLKSQKCISLATVGEDNKPWISNAYYSINSDFEIFFMSSTEARHSKDIASNPSVSFSVSWFDKNNLENRKAIQGIGECTRLSNPLSLASHIKGYHDAFPAWKDHYTLKAITEKIVDARPYIIKPSYIKYWDDELFGKDEIIEIDFSEE